jgi:hypothetical protein
MSTQEDIQTSLTQLYQTIHQLAQLHAIACPSIQVEDSIDHLLLDHERLSSTKAMRQLEQSYFATFHQQFLHTIQLPLYPLDKRKRLLALRHLYVVKAIELERIFAYISQQPSYHLIEPSILSSQFIHFIYHLQNQIQYYIHYVLYLL